MWILRAAFLGGLVLSLGCNPCRRFDARPETVCLAADGGTLEGQTFELTATVSIPAQLSCTVGVDSGVIDLVLSGDDCQPQSPSSGVKPVLVQRTTRCVVPPLEAGQYIVLGATRAQNVLLTIGGDAGAGLPDCP